MSGSRCGDHFYPLEADGPGAGSFDAVASHTALAGTTTKARVGVLVYSVGYRHPAVLANAISAIDHLSGGRAEVALGAGWHEPEYRAYGLPFEPAGERLDKLEEGVQCLAGLLRKSGSPSRGSTSGSTTRRWGTARSKIGYRYPGGVIIGSDDRVLDGLKAFEEPPPTRSC